MSNRSFKFHKIGNPTISQINCVYLVSAIYNLSLQLQRLGHFVIVLRLRNVL